MNNLKNALEAFKKLSSKEVDYLLDQLLYEERIDIPKLVSAYAKYLSEFKHSAQNDIQKLAEAGLTLGEKEIKKIKSIKSDRKKELYTALAHTLLRAGFRDTKFNQELSANIDVSIVNENWYENSWALKTVVFSKNKEIKS